MLDVLYQEEVKRWTVKMEGLISVEEVIYDAQGRNFEPLIVV